MLIDRPLVKTALTAREKNETFYKTALETVLLQRSLTKQVVEFDSRKRAAFLDNSDLDSKFPDLSQDNVTYHLWKFGSLTLLIRCKIHGFISDVQVTSHAVLAIYVFLGNSLCRN